MNFLVATSVRDVREVGIKISNIICFLSGFFRRIVYNVFGESGLESTKESLY